MGDIGVEKERAGIAFAPLPGTGPARFAPIKFGDFLRGELQASYDAHKEDAPK